MKCEKCYCSYTAFFGSIWNLQDIADRLEVDVKSLKQADAEYVTCNGVVVLRCACGVKLNEVS